MKISLRRQFPVVVTLVAVLLFGATAKRVTASPGQPPDAFELRDGDRVVFLGNALIERAQEHGYIEMALTTRWPARSVTFRNLGWSGDTVYGAARGHYTNPPGAYEHLVQQVRTLDPTVIFVGYGMNASLEGEQPFEKGLSKLLDDLGETGARIILLSPTPHEKARSPVPDPSSRNARLQRVTAIIEEVAQERGLRFVDLFRPFRRLARETDVPLTTNGIHLSRAGYFAAAAFIERGLGLDPRRWRVEIDARSQEGQAAGARLASVRKMGQGVTFALQNQFVPLPPPAVPAEFLSRLGYDHTLKAAGLPEGSYRLSVDGEAVTQKKAAAWEDGVLLRSGPALARARRLLQAIRRKNRLYFYRYRPQNETYLVGFREYEQGQNAEELEQRAPLIDEEELVIGQLRTAGHTRVYTLELREER